MEKLLSYLIGAAGDACISYRKNKGEYCVEYEQKNRQWLLRSILPRINRCFGTCPVIHCRKSGLFRLRLYSKKAYEQFKPVWENPDCVLEWPLESQREFVRGFFDAEGSAPARKRGCGWRLHIYQKDVRKLEVIRIVLERHGIKAGRITNSRNIGLLPVRRKSNLERFSKIFCPEHPDKSKALSVLVFAEPHTGSSRARDGQNHFLQADEQSLIP